MPRKPPSLDPGSLASRLEAELQRMAPQLSAIRRHLHEHPELSGEERATTAYLARQLTAAKIPFRLGQGKRGIITDVQPAEAPKAPTIALRADIDALPILEENRASYRSRNSGVMHACGHDAHSAILLGTTLALHRAGKLAVAWKSIFQPSEEVGHGAAEMVEQGAVQDVQAIIAWHVDPSLPVGQVSITPGPQSAFCQDFLITIRGKGGHGARPHLTIDPIAIAAQLVTLIYQAVPRQTDARDPVVVTIGSIQGGQASNIIPDHVALKGTIRALDRAVADETRQTLERLCAGTAQSFRARIEPLFDGMLNGIVNDLSIAEHCLATARKVIGSARVQTNRRPSLGAEDFADYLPAVPGCMMLLGTKSRQKKMTPLHTGTFDINESALELGTRLFARILMDWPLSTR